MSDKEESQDELLNRSWLWAEKAGVVFPRHGSVLDCTGVDPRRLTFAEEDWLLADSLAGKAEPMKIASPCGAGRWEWVDLEEAEGEDFKGCALYFSKGREKAFDDRWGKFWRLPQGSSKYDPESVAEILNPYGGGRVLTGAAMCAALFMRDLLELPRLVVRDPYSDRAPWVYVAPFTGDPGDDYLLGVDGMPNFVRGSFADFKDWVADVGRQFECRGKAEAVLAWSGMLYRWMESETSLEETYIEQLRECAKRLEVALYDMAIAVAGNAKKSGRSPKKKHTEEPGCLKDEVYQVCKLREECLKNLKRKRVNPLTLIEKMGDRKIRTQDGSRTLREWAGYDSSKGRAKERITKALNTGSHRRTRKSPKD